MNRLQTRTHYDAWADKLLLSAVCELPEHELTAHRPIVFGSILSTLSRARRKPTLAEGLEA